MVTNYLKMAWRNLVKYKGYTFINLSGLAVGMACCILIYLWISDEYNIDKFHKSGEQLYSVLEKQYHDGRIDVVSSSPGLLADELKKVFPEVEMACSVDWINVRTFQAGEKIIKMPGIYAGSDFFKMFSYPIIRGYTETALQGPLDICISRKMAKQLFESEEGAVGKTLRFQNSKDLKIAAVFDDITNNATHQFDFVINWDFFLKENGGANDWENNFASAYIKIRPDASAQKTEAKLERFLDGYNKDQNDAFYIRLFLQKYTDAYLYSYFENGQQAGGRIEYVRLFGWAGLFILIIACINFMNLATARSTKRAKEVGLRKVIGANSKSLIYQFIGESFLISLIAFLIALTMVSLLLPYFNQLTQKQMVMPFGQPIFIVVLLGILILTAVFSGIYPAFYLASFNPIAILKGHLGLPGKEGVLRKGLVVFQFVLTIVFLVGTVVVYRQLDYIQHKSLGYDKENLLNIRIEGELVKKFNLFKDRAETLKGIKSISAISERPTKIGNTTGGIHWPGKDESVNIQFVWASVSYDLIRTMDLQLLQGNDFSKELSTDSVGYLVNETALKRIGYQDAIGKSLSMWGRSGKIIGVVKDFHYNSLHQIIEPFIIRLVPVMSYGKVLVRTEKGETKTALAGLGRLYKELNPAFPFEYEFADEAYSKSYRSEEVISSLANIFAGLTIFISCLGLFGLAAFTADQRIKEIGIRKVLGANTFNIIRLMSGDFIKLLIIALIISFPLAWWGMNKWLEAYPYKIVIGPGIFAFAGITILTITILTVSFQSIKAAMANPMKSLRTE